MKATVVGQKVFFAKIIHHHISLMLEPDTGKKNRDSAVCNPLQELVFPHLDSIARQIERRSDCRLSGESEVIFSDADYASIFGAEYKKWLKMIDSEVNKWKGSGQRQVIEGVNDRAVYWGLFFSPSTEGSLDQYIETLATEGSSGKSIEPLATEGSSDKSIEPPASACCCSFFLHGLGLFSAKSRNSPILSLGEETPLMHSLSKEELVRGAKTIISTVFDDVKKQLLLNMSEVPDEFDLSREGELRSFANLISRYIVLEIVAYMSQQFMEITGFQQTV